MAISRENLEKYFESISDFESKYYLRQVELLGYYLQVHENMGYFEATEIRECFDLLNLQVPDDIEKLLDQAKQGGMLISKLRGYRISRKGLREIKAELEKIELKERIYIAGQNYDLYKDIKSIISSATNEVFIVDTYAHEDIIDLYLDKLPNGIKMKILTSNPQPNFEGVAKKFKQKHQSNFIVRTNDRCHDRIFFIDKKCYVYGQSLDRAAQNKPTYLIQVESSGAFRQVFQSLFDQGKILV
jgi:hypothetical protein